MGLDKHGVRLLLEARAQGASFERVATIGRQNLHIDAPTLADLLTSYGLPTSDAGATGLLREASGFCEPLLRLLGAGDVCSVDLSSYENATVLHDMNEPIPDSLRGRFSVVIESGSLEHVFNFPRAIANCMQMVKTGGHLLVITPVNNMAGHGFYQFSPELFFRVLGGDNGFAMERMVAYQECWPFDEWYVVRDPAQIRRRVTLLNRYPAFLLITARKTEDVPLFTRTPQQSDYVTVWQDASTGNRTVGSRSTGAAKGGMAEAVDFLKGAAVRLVPVALKRRYQRRRAGGRPFDPAFYEAFDGRASR